MSGRGRLVGEGGYAQVFEVDEDTVVKVVPISERRKKNRDLKSSGHNENPWRELHIHERVNSLRSPRPAAVRMKRFEELGSELRLYLDRYEGDLTRLDALGRRGGGLVKSACLQVLAAYHALCSRLGFYHGDPGLANILFKRVPEKRERVYISGRTVSFENAGLRIAVSDFGTALVDGFEMSTEEKKYYKRCDPRLVPDDAWRVFVDIADSAPWHAGLADLVREAVCFRRYSKDGYSFESVRPGWTLERVIAAVRKF